MRISSLRASFPRIIITLTFIWVLCGPCTFALDIYQRLDKPVLQELVQTSSFSLPTEIQQLIKNVALHTLFNTSLTLLPERELATSPELYVGAAERNPFYLLPTIHAP